MKQKLIKYLIISVLTFSTGVLSAQQSIRFKDLEHNYFKALELYNKHQYGAAQKLFQETMEHIESPKHNLKIQSEYYNAICAVHLFNNNAEVLLHAFIDEHPQNANIKYIYFQLGNFQYSKKNYRGVVKSFKKVDAYDLSAQERIEYHFKYGYTFFQLKKVEEAQKHFFQIINKDSRFKSSAIYYYSHIAYTQKNYQTALKGFLSLKDDASFKPVIPYYVTHIYYLQENYTELLNIAPSLYEKATPGRKSEIARLIGEAYYRTEKYKEAIPFLKEYHKDAGQYASPSEQYQLAFSFYKMKKYNKAIEYFRPVAIGHDSLNQNANYHMAYCYTQLKKKKFALNAFQSAYKIDRIDQITEDALYNFAKLSYELSYNPYNQAIIAFNLYLKKYPKSEYREELVGYLSKMYLSTRNYAKALESIEKIEQRSPELEQAYQRILYLRAVELFNTAKYDVCVDYFDKAISSNQQAKFTANALYWKGEALYRLGYYKQSVATFGRFLNSPAAFGSPEYAKAYYHIGYCHFKEKNYTKALENYRLFIMSNKTKQASFISDAYMRTADCYLVGKQLDKAIENYDLAVSMNQSNTDYALLKKAEAYGTQQKFNDKTIVLKQLLDQYPKSPYFGITKYELAQTYYRSLDDPKMALKYYKSLIESHPKNLSYVKQAMLDIGILYNGIEENQQAITSLKDVVRHFKGSKESKTALKILQNIYTEINDPDGYFDFIRSLGINPGVEEQESTYYYAAETVYLNGDCEKAIKGMANYIERFPTGSYVAKANYFWADCLYKSAKYDEALTHYIKVVGLPVMEFTLKSYKQIGYISYEKKQDYQKSLEAYRQAVKMSIYKEDKNVALVGIMNSQFKLQNFTAVLKAVEQVLNIENLDEFIRIDAYMKKAKSAIALKDNILANTSLNDIIILSRSIASAEARYLLAWMAYDQKLYEKSEALVYEVIDQDPSYEYWIVKAFILSADISVKTDNMYQAKATLTSIVNGYDKDAELLQEAKTKLQVILDAEAKEKEEQKKEDDDVEIEFSDDDLLLNDLWEMEEEELELEVEEE